MKLLRATIRAIYEATSDDQRGSQLTAAELDLAVRMADNMLHLSVLIEVLQKAYLLLRHADLSSATLEERLVAMQLRRSLYRLLVTYERRVPPPGLE